MKFIVPIFNQQYTRTESRHPRSEPSFKRAAIFHSAVVISFCIIAGLTALLAENQIVLKQIILCYQAE